MLLDIDPHCRERTNRRRGPGEKAIVFLGKKKEGRWQSVEVREEINGKRSEEKKQKCVCSPTRSSLGGFWGKRYE